MTNSAAEAIPQAPVLTPDAGRWAPLWVIVFVALWPTPGLAETVLSLGALFAAYRLLHARFRGGTRLLSGAAWALTSVLFLAYWLPQILSAFDAVDAGRALRKSATDLRYLPFMWLCAIAVANAQRRRRTFTGLAVIGGVWTLDALLQAAFGTSPLFFGIDQVKQLISGHGLCTAQELALVDRLSGVLGPCNLKFGQTLASLSPFLLLALGRRHVLAWLVGAAAVGIVLVLAGSRASWITYGVIVLLSGWQLLGGHRLLAVAVVAVAPQARERIQRTTLAFGNGEQGVDQALSGRAQIWEAALCMIRTHPLNGVGARGFRQAYPACNPAPGQAPAWGGGPAFHAHQIVLEILAETGVIGLLLWLAGAAQAWRAWRYSSAVAREQARPAMIALVATVFPFNTHLAFYSSFWGGLSLMLAGLYAGALLNDDADRAPQ
ncbi:O-antigen ligase family protein [Xanthomonas phaseoli]|uniref:O-antigen ligase-related domain-containing protein n=1 Tax=Xanthomonas phaseoli pv. dieffenbachiae TaxID=92828 RepID=A0A1V9H1P8_9XANT|nr:O-antigen ligase [Xanthomonas phaseoli]MBO9787802.1 O-antigen ligase family protein [Xanthomonas phaseoli pv. dieffenbachiae]MBO9885006.1 O-antigen ligase family protein [Xanthomonas phaseoli pv. dieffenbachiae]MBO9914163.1 O-antigen ligase family protein [Xanthomonas phaseoli pv. dieffenbachiae]MBO9939469.1 O-antigen ligase family protein [Xanthomonas phaseoli pv. dieffenbachiae]MBO9995127.1 O-antigen ligase family protein [Xanthomonas phaseoli pv. dieffenbachiae]